MKKQYRIVCAGLALCMGIVPMQAAAASPDFAYTFEEWEKLRDDCLEFSEIPDLVHEYNSTVQQNQYEYQDYKDKSSYDISKDYYDAANALTDKIDYPDDTNAAYAGLLTSALNSEIQAESLREQGDNNVDDGEIKRLGYASAEAKLVKQAQELMIEYWDASESLSSYLDVVETEKENLGTMEIKYQAGLVVKSAVESSKKSLADAEANRIGAENKIEQTRGSLLLMLGWEHDADVEITKLPEPDIEWIENICLEEDIEKALKQNYELQVTQRRIENAEKATVREKQEQIYQNQKKAAAESVENQYQNLLLAKVDYEQAQNAEILSERNLQTSRVQYQAGIITAKELEKQEKNYYSAQLSVKTAERTLLKNQLAYEWEVNGLADVS